MPHARDELRYLGAQIHFVCRHITSFMRQQLESKGYALSILPALEERSSDLAHSAWLGVSQETDAAATITALADSAPLDWLVVDHYALDERWEKILYGSAKRLLVIDDLADRFHFADLLLDQNLQSSSNRYLPLLRKGTKCLIGPRYALLRPEFKEARSYLVPTNDRAGLNVFFGGIDLDGMTVVALQALKRIKSRTFAVDVIVGADNPRRTIIAELCNDIPDVALHIQPRNIERLFAAAVLALGAGGATSWERCCLALPTVLVSIAANQRNGCLALAQTRAGIYLGEMSNLDPGILACTIVRALARPRLLSDMAKRAATLVDGWGTSRVVEAMGCS